MTHLYEYFNARCRSEVEPVTYYGFDCAKIKDTLEELLGEELWFTSGPDEEVYCQRKNSDVTYCTFQKTFWGTNTCFVHRKDVKDAVEALGYRTVVLV